jgi:two-component system cell cycle sensor histidine kinase/response regulator CckA
MGLRPLRPGDAMPDDAVAAGLSARLTSTLDSIDEGIQIIGFDWRYFYVNQAACGHGRRRRDELLGQTMMEVYPGIDETPMFRALQRCMTLRQTQEMENEFTYPNGARAWFDLRIHPCPEGVVIISVDVTERKRLEAQLRQAQKMDAIGKLAGGVAHDFNNLLTAITGFTSFALQALPAEHAVAADLQEVLGAAERAAALTRQLMTFARQHPVDPRIIDVSELVTRADRLLRRLLGEDIDIVTRAAADLWHTLIDPGALEQVLINLAVNARDAMPGGGRLTIETMNAPLDEAHSLRRGGEIPPGDYVVLGVSDDGAGMDARTQEQIFEPFFTTKPVGKGTGFGLSTCYGVVRQAGGHIWVYSEPGHGSTFKIYLPRVRGEVEPLPAAPVEQQVGGHETILLVEDEAQVRQAALRSLAPLGYLVLVAAGPDQALALAAAHAGTIDLLLTDIVMPGLGGRALADRLTARYPGLRTLYISGYTETAIVHRGVLGRGAQLLAKPFTPRALAERVRAVLDGPAAAAP